MKNFYDIETQQTISETELEKEFQQAKTNQETDAETFEDYIDNCLTLNNGTLEEINLTDEEIKELANIILISGAKDSTEDNCNFYKEELEKIIKKEFNLYDLKAIEQELWKHEEATADTFIDEDLLQLEIFYYIDYVDKINSYEKEV